MHSSDSANDDVNWCSLLNLIYCYGANLETFGQVDSEILLYVGRIGSAAVT